MFATKNTSSITSRPSLFGLTCLVPAIGLHYTTLHDKLATQHSMRRLQRNSFADETPMHTGVCSPRKFIAVVNFALSSTKTLCFPLRYTYRLQYDAPSIKYRVASHHKPETVIIRSIVIRKRASRPSSGRKTAVLRLALFWRPAAARSIPAASASTRPNEASEKTPPQLGRRRRSP